MRKSVPCFERKFIIIVGITIESMSRMQHSEGTLMPFVNEKLQSSLIFGKTIKTNRMKLILNTAVKASSTYLLLLFTWKKESTAVCKNYTIVTSESDHSCFTTSFGFNNFIVSQLSNYEIDTVKFWSDGCTPQFGSQYAFYMISKCDPWINRVALLWNYSWKRGSRWNRKDCQTCCVFSFTGNPSHYEVTQSIWRLCKQNLTPYNSAVYGKRFHETWTS